MASTSEESASNKRKIDGEGDDPCKEKEAKTGDPIVDTVLAVNIKINETWIRIGKALTEAKVRPCTEYGPGRMAWTQGKFSVFFSVVASYNCNAKDVVTSYSVTYCDPLVQHESFREDQQAEAIEFLKIQIERAWGRAVRDALLSYVDNEALRWKELMRLLIDNPKIPFAPTWRADGNYVSLQWKRGERCVTLDRSLDDDCDMRFRVDRSRTWDDELMPCKYFQKPEEAVTQVEEWVALL